MRLHTVFALLLLTFSQIAFADEAYVIAIDGTINPATSSYLTRALDTATEKKAKFLLVELNTPGGLVSSVREMAQTIDKSTMPVVVYTTPAGASATSAGAILMISSHLAAMAPGSNIGAAHPVNADGEDIKGAMAEKAVNDISAFARSMATLRKRNATAAEEVVIKSSSFTAEEALKKNLIEIIAKDRADLFKQMNKRSVAIKDADFAFATEPAPTLIPIEMTIGEKLLHYVSHPNIAAILMTLGIMLIYAELSAPGLGIPGILGGTCLIVAFISFQALPIRTGGMALVLAGVGLMLAEIFIGTGALAFGGAIALVLGLLWLIDPAATDLTISPVIITIIGAFAIGVALLFVYGLKRIKRTGSESLSSSGVIGYTGIVESVSEDGKSGLVKIRGELWKFASTQNLNPGDTVETVKVDGLELKVKRK